MGGRPFTKQQVTRTLRNALYIDRVRWGDSYKDDTHEAIIEKPQFNRVQKKLNKTKQTHHNHRYARGRDYPLKGLVRCGCGAMLTPKSATSVREELIKLEEEKRQLRDRLQAHAEQTAPKTAMMATGKTFIDTWSSVGESLEQATPEEQRTILQHYIEVVEITFDDPAGKMGKYALRLFPEVCPADQNPSRNGNGTPIRGSALTENANLCLVDEKAPRVGLEPTTQRLTAACSTD